MLFKSDMKNSESIIGANFLLIFLGSLLVTINAKLLGLKYSIFFYICVMGYSLAPFVIAAAVNWTLSIVIKRIGVLIVTAICYLWAVKSVSVYF